MKPGRIAVIVVGVLLALPALALIVGGTALTVDRLPCHLQNGVLQYAPYGMKDFSNFIGWAPLRVGWTV